MHFKTQKMLTAFIISAILLLAGILSMGMRIFFTRSGKFPNIHIGGNEGLKKNGISCATSQDRQAQETANKLYYKDLIKNATE